MNAEKESNPQKVAQKKKQKQVESLPFSMHETESLNAQAKKPNILKPELSGNDSKLTSDNQSIPAVHSSNSVYSEGSELKHKELQASLEQTGDITHPETQQKEKDYKNTLGITELRDYHDAKSGNANVVQEKSEEEKVKTATQVKKEEATIVQVNQSSVPEGTVANNNDSVLNEKSDKESFETKHDIALAKQTTKENEPLQDLLPKTVDSKVANADKQIKKVNTGDPGNLLLGLSNTPATELAVSFNSVQIESATVLNTQNKEAETRLPKINAAQGSAFSNSKSKNNQSSEKTIAKAGKKIVKASSPKNTLKEISFPEKAPLKKENYSFQSSGNKKVAIDKQAQNQLDSIRLNTTAIPTRLQENANLDLSGDASIDHLTIEQNDASQDMNIKKSQASKDIHKDYGENNIIKQPGNEVLKTNHKLKAKNSKVNPIKSFKSEGMDEMAINSNFEPIVQSKIGAEKDKYDVAQLEHDQKVQEEENVAGTKIEAEKSKSKDKQLKSVREAQGDVNKSRTEWQKELNKTETDFAKKAGDQAKATMGKIQTEKTAGESKAQDHINKANQDARKKKEDADKEAAQKKLEKKKESGGFFGWVADKASAFINALKDALNFIFTKLREAVKAIFDIAKKLVVAVLEFARKAIVSFIKGFAVLLKGFLDIALAAFPAIRDRLKAKIDHYVAVAEKFVNQTFDLFKKTVTAIIDFLAETLDKLLGLIQSIYDGILTVVGMIVRNEIGPLLEKLGNIKDALFDITFATIKQGGMEELLGANLDESLSPEELMAAMQMGLLSGANEQDSDDGMPKAPWSNANVGVDVVSFEELSPEMQAELRRMQKGGQTEATLGERNDPSRTMSSVMEDAKTPQSTPESGQKFNDGLTPMKRAEIKWEMMKTGIKQWWDNNWLKVVGGIIAALVVFIAAEVVTGGAITAALPVIMPILADVFIGITIAQLATHFVDGLAKSWGGDKKGGTKAFSRGLGAALIELAMYLGFKLVEVAAKAITQLVKSGVKLIKAGARSVMNFGKFIIKQGKVLFKGIAGKNLGKLNKSLRKLADDILERMRIKKVSLKIQGKRWEVLAEINPLFVIMAGALPDEEVMSIVKKEKGEVPKGLKKGETFIDDQGRELMKISRLDEFTRTPNYREIFELANKRGISDDIIHHLIEKGSDFAYLFEKELINAPKSLRAIPKGNINEVLHLSDIRNAWNKVYSDLKRLQRTNMIDEVGIKNKIVDFAGKTDIFIKQSLDDIAKAELNAGRQLTQNEIATITNNLKYLLK